MGTVRDEQHSRETEPLGATVMMSSSGSTKVFLLVHYRSRELCVVMNMPKKHSFSLTSRAISLSAGGSERAPSVSEVQMGAVCDASSESVTLSVVSLEASRKKTAQYLYPAWAGGTAAIMVCVDLGGRP